MDVFIRTNTSDKISINNFYLFKNLGFSQNPGFRTWTWTRPSCFDLNVNIYNINFAVKKIMSIFSVCQSLLWLSLICHFLVCPSRHLIHQPVCLSVSALTRRQVSKSVLLDDLFALRSFARPRAARDEDDSLPRHVQRRVDDHVDRLTGLLKNVLLLALSRDLDQFALVLVHLWIINSLFVCFYHYLLLAEVKMPYTAFRELTGLFYLTCLIGPLSEMSNGPSVTLSTNLEKGKIFQKIFLLPPSSSVSAFDMRHRQFLHLGLHHCPFLHLDHN